MIQFPGPAIGRTIYLLLLSAIFTLPAPVTAQDQVETDDTVEETSNDGRNRPPGRGRSSGRPLGRIDDNDGPYKSEPFESGWFFVDGQYVPPPYVVTHVDGVTSINGYTLSASNTDDLRQHFNEDIDDEDEGRGGRQRRAKRRSPGRSVAGILDQGNLLLIRTGDSPLVLNESGTGLELLEWLAGQPHPTNTLPALLKKIPKDHRGPVQSWVAEHEPGAELARRARETIHNYRSAEAENERHIAALRRLEAWNYPLSVVGMVLCAFAFGHLLRNHPPEESDKTASSQNRRLVYRSLALAAGFSVLDLAWTLLALHAGTMQELNPIASGLIHSPLGLAAFKVSLTTLAVALIAALWKHRAAQVASWWACLILTLLTVRWLTLNSLIA